MGNARKTSIKVARRVKETAPPARCRRTKIVTTVASEKLRKLVLVDGGPLSMRIQREFNRAQLWRWYSAKRRPELETLIELDDMTHGDIAIREWAKPLGSKKTQVRNRAA